MSVNWRKNIEMHNRMLMTLKYMTTLINSYKQTIFIIYQAHRIYNMKFMHACNFNFEPYIQLYPFIINT